MLLSTRPALLVVVQKPKFANVINIIIINAIVVLIIISAIIIIITIISSLIAGE